MPSKAVLENDGRRQARGRNEPIVGREGERQDQTAVQKTRQLRLWCCCEVTEYLESTSSQEMCCALTEVAPESLFCGPWRVASTD